MRAFCFQGCNNAQLFVLSRISVRLFVQEMASLLSCFKQKVVDDQANVLPLACKLRSQSPPMSSWDELPHVMCCFCCFKCWLTKLPHVMCCFCCFKCWLIPSFLMSLRSIHWVVYAFALFDFHGILFTEFLMESMLGRSWDMRVQVFGFDARFYKFCKPAGLVRCERIPIFSPVLRKWF